MRRNRQRKAVESPAISNARPPQIFTELIGYHRSERFIVVKDDNGYTLVRIVKTASPALQLTARNLIQTSLETLVYGITSYDARATGKRLNKLFEVACLQKRFQRNTIVNERARRRSTPKSSDRSGLQIASQ